MSTETSPAFAVHSLPPMSASVGSASSWLPPRSPSPPSPPAANGHADDQDPPKYLPDFNSPAYSTSVPPSSSSCLPPPAPTSSPSTSSQLPKIGTIRCYWTVLSPALDFFFLDPILESHMGEWANKLHGTNLLDWVHPEERRQLAEDLLPKDDCIAGIEGAGVFGSVTRLRYSRVVRVMRSFGCTEPPRLPDASIYAIDDDYLSLDLTTSWIAGNGTGKGKDRAGPTSQGAVLAFFHAVEDKDHVKNNDPHEHGDWTNWCGVHLDEHTYLSPSRCASLVDVLDRITSSTSSSSSPRSSSSHSDGVVAAAKEGLLAALHGLGSETDDGPPAHVFQILDRNGKAIVSFPKSEAPDGRKRYEVEEYAALAREVVARPRGAANAKTSCTKRYRSKHPVMKNSTLTTIESVVIMYGAITFACFQTGGIYLTSARKAALGLGGAADLSTGDFNLEDVPPTTPTLSAFPGNKRASPPGDIETERASQPVGTVAKPDSPQNKRLKPSPPTAGAVVPIAPAPSSSSSAAAGAGPNGLSISTAASRLYRPSLESEYGVNGGISPTVASASAILGSISASHGEPQQPQGQQQGGTYDCRSSTFPYPTQPPRQDFSAPSPYPPYFQSAPHASSSSYGYTNPPYVQQQPQQNNYLSPSPSSQPPVNPAQPAYGLSSADPYQHPAPSASAYDPARQDSVDRTSLPPPSGSKPASPTLDKPAAKKPPRQRPDGPALKPPAPGVKQCESCGTANSPEWRKGPSGSKSLCNACGLRYARSVARQKKLAEQAANGGAPSKKKKGKDVDQCLPISAPPGTSAPSSLATSSFDTPAYSRASPHPTPKPYTPYYTTGPPPQSTYATHSHATTQPPLYPPSTGAGAFYPPASVGGYSAATYPPNSAPVMTHIPIHHTFSPVPPYSGHLPPLAPHAFDGGHPQQHPQQQMVSPPTMHSQGPASVGMYASHSSGSGHGGGGGGGDTGSSGGWQHSNPHPHQQPPQASPQLHHPHPHQLPPGDHSHPHSHHHPHHHPQQQQQQQQQPYPPYQQWDSGAASGHGGP
ncbi:hypothetical protein JCM1840_000463 [Sporobolomyces johnsonii]